MARENADIEAGMVAYERRKKAKKSGWTTVIVIASLVFVTIFGGALLMGHESGAVWVH